MKRICTPLLIFTIALVVRAFTAYFISSHFDDPGWFPSGIYHVFDSRAQAIIDGTGSAFWITDTTDPSAAIYPPGYSLWLASVYELTGIRSPQAVQVTQVLLDSVSVFLIFAIGKIVFDRKIGIAGAVIAALSPLLAFYGATPLADAPTSWIVLSAILCFVLAVKREIVWYAMAAGALIGLSCWFRANGLMLGFCWAVALIFLLHSTWSRRIKFAGAILLAAAIVISPVVIRNSIAFQAFVPTGLGLGTNLWEGIGETSRAAEFGAVYGDRELIEKERVEQALGDDPRVSLYWPDGVERDRARAKKAISVIASDPFWYAGVMAGRMWGLLKYAGDDSGIYGSTGVNITPKKNLPESWRFVPISTVATLLGWMQSVLRIIALPLMLGGILIAFRTDRLFSCLLLATVFYYLVFGTFLHSEIRYSLPMQAVLTIFAGVAVTKLLGMLGRRKIAGQHLRSDD